MLRRLADRLGILPAYVDMAGRERRASDDACRTLLAIMGFDAPTEDAARGWLAELDHEARETILEPVRVVERDAAAAGQIRVRVPPGVANGEVELTLTEETGHVWRVSAPAVHRGVTLRLPTHVPYGYHDLAVTLHSSGKERSATQSFIVVPSRCTAPDVRVGKRRVMGIVANLYAARREGDWGVGDCSTLMQLVEWAGARRAAFVGVNPLHALFNRGGDISPYSPASRLFRNHLYLDVEAVPEFPRLRSHEPGDDIARLRASPVVEYDAVIVAKERVLLALYRIFLERRDGAASQRAREFGEFVAAREPELTRHATWMAIAEDAGSTDWRRWPAGMQRPESETVRAFQRAHEERIGFHRWLQFETWRQLGQVASRARALGMPIGVYQDLAIGTNPGSSDTWSHPDLFLPGATLGAPPDPYSATGQNWGLPPIDPRALKQQRYRYWVQLLRHGFEHAGALRVDHVMGLFRTYWIPEGGTGLDGAYVRSPAADLLGILALESVRHDAIVVGEDLGTVPREVPPALRKWCILSSKVLYFERRPSGGGFVPANRYPRLALATANTHDMAPLAGFWAGRDVELRERVGLLRTAREADAERRQRERDRQALLRLLRLHEPHAFEQEHFPRMLAGAVHEFLCSTPAVLVGLSLDDLLGEVDPVNVPGVGPDRYASWRRRNRMTLEEMAWRFEVDGTIRCAGRRGPGGG